MKECDRQEYALSRRTVLGAGLGVAPLLIAAAQAEAQDAPDPASEPPQRGDHFVYLAGPKTGEPIRPEDLPPGGPQVQAYPAAPDGTVRNGTRLNLVILARIGDDGVDDETQKVKNQASILFFVSQAARPAWPPARPS